MTEKNRSWLTIACTWVLLLILAYNRPLSLPDEGRYADIGRWMFTSGDWLVPRLNGIPFLHKPPLLYWLQAEVFGLVGVHVWAARWVTALHALLLITCIHLGVRHVQGETAARKATMVLGSSIGFLIGGQYINHDFMVATWISISIGLFAIALQHEGRSRTLLARLGFMACGLGVLSKGLIGLVLPGMVLTTWVILTGQWRQVIRLPWISGLALFCAIALPWMWQMQTKFSGFFDYFIVQQHFSRFTGTNFNNPQPLWFYPAVIAILMFPWVLFVLADLVKSAVGFRKIRIAPLDPWAALPWVWLLIILLFFSLPKSKLIGYILPVVPPVALLAARSWDRLFGSKPSSERWFGLVFGLSLALAIGANLLARHNSLKDDSLDVAHQLSCASQSTDRIFVAGSYPFDLPFENKRSQALIVLQDWEQVSRSTSDGWRRIFYEGGEFDPQARLALQNMDTLQKTPADGHSWLVAPAETAITKTEDGWHIVFKGKAWWLWRKQEVSPSGPLCK
jgi:4-amino-4-deoxy-L-arabinose transferase-like glycosyltransferase